MNGLVDADIHGIIQGTVSAMVDTGVIDKQPSGETEQLEENEVISHEA